MRYVKNCGKTDKGPSKLNALLNYPITEEQTQTMFCLMSDRFINKMELQIVKHIKTIFIRCSSRGFKIWPKVYMHSKCTNTKIHTQLHVQTAKKSLILAG